MPKIVMISSTARDLPSHRKEVMEACLMQDMLPKMMEHLPASDDDAISASLNMVDEADIYLGIYAYRYGYIPQGYDISITEMEYNRAVERKIPRLLFVMAEDHPILPHDMDTGEGAEKLKTFKNRIQLEKVANFFNSPADLRAKVVNSLSHVPDNSHKKEEFVQEARRMERTGAFAEAIDVWREIQAIDPSDETVDKEVDRLNAREALRKEVNEKTKQLTLRITELGPYFKTVVEFLKQPALSPDSPQLSLIDQYLNNQLPKEPFIDAWDVLSDEPVQSKSEEPNFRAMADRIKHAEMVLFFGPEIASLYQTPKQDALIHQLAEQADYPDFSGSLATIGEYYQIQADYGRTLLVDNLRGLIQSKPVAIPLYRKLAQIQQPLVLISANYDTLLEDAFKKAGKKYALLSSVINSTMDSQIGNILGNLEKPANLG